VRDVNAGAKIDPSCQTTFLMPFLDRIARFAGCFPRGLGKDQDTCKASAVGCDTEYDLAVRQFQ
jgi:hypothetical protein